ncbi:acyl-CoA dehydrogenase [Virgisporangium aliadipatigenens]|uniref:Acyl-CoA dehydrogenase n=1 Tax=Virgisporangium aliadipatigenens TaxID=741659 RepID=A0A8J3YS92_9ACTN|nr:acyl-CoA dehydrogenase family protein [Virgisporangium aliadipatigenens]GIJ48803.1 acyl-CoA dehydrogenase [Virgisporangium aliadipatigenens]
MTPERSAFRAFVDETVAPRADEFERDERIPDDVYKAVGAHGWWGAVVPASAGGTGFDMRTLAALHEEIGRGCSSLRSLLTVHTMGAYALYRWGSAAAREQWLPDVVTGAARMAFCLTEPQAGSDATMVATTATPDGSDFVLDGVKRWITGGQVADLFLVFARTPRGPAAFLVDARNPGVSRSPISNVLGTRASMLAEVRLTGCRVPGTALVGAAGAGMLVATGALDLGRLSVAAGSCGIIDACLDATVAHTAGRVQGGGLLRDHQLVRAKVSDMLTDLYAARELVSRAARLKDAGDPETINATWVAKYHASTAAMRAATDAVQLHGALGCADGHPVNRYFRDAKVMEIIEGSTQIQQVTIAEHAYRRVPAANASGGAR